MTLATVKGPIPGGVLHRDCDKGNANALLIVSTPLRAARRLLFVTVAYSGAVTKNVPVGLDSGAGEEYDGLLKTIALTSTKYGVWIPDGDVYILPDDSIAVRAPAGGSGVTATIAIYTVVQ